MIVSIEVQVEPLDGAHKFTDSELKEMQGLMFELCSSLEQRFKQYIRCDMLVDERRYDG